MYVTGLSILAASLMGSYKKMQEISKVCIVSMFSSPVPQEFLPTLQRKFSSSYYASVRKGAVK